MGPNQLYALLKLSANIEQPFHRSRVRSMLTVIFRFRNLTVPPSNFAIRLPPLAHHSWSANVTRWLSTWLRTHSGVLLDYHVPTCSSIAVAHKQVGSLLFSHKRWISQWEQCPHQPPSCACAKYSQHKLFQHVSQVRGHLVAPMADLQLPDNLQRLVAHSAKTQVWPAFKQFETMFLQAVSKWADKNRLNFPVDLVHDFLQEQWPLHLQAAVYTFTGKDVKTLEAMFKEFVFLDKIISLIA